MNIYSIVQSLHAANGTIEKQAILDSHKDNGLLKNFVKATLDPGINYYIKKLPKTDAYPTQKNEFAQIDIEMMMELADRKFTGLDAYARLGGHASAVAPETRTLLQYMLDHKIGKTSVGETMALKTWPGLFFTVPYQRCSLLDKKARERFAKLKRFFVQTKADGMFSYVVRRLDGSVDVITRQGSKFPQWFAEKMAAGLKPGYVMVGELLVDEKMEGMGSQSLDRKTANGLLNSALKDGDTWDERKYSARIQAWDLLTQEEFEAGKSTREYETRFRELDLFLHVNFYAAHVEVIESTIVSSLEEAFVIYQRRLQEGLEGCIIKDPASLWKDGTAKDMVKLKIKFAVEMRVKRLYEGEGKDAGSLGGVGLETEDGGIENNCGSGFDAKQRREFWDNPELILNQVVTVEANDITQSRDGRKKPSLSLPIFCEVRYDKTVADTTERIYAQLEAAKQGA